MTYRVRRATLEDKEWVVDHLGYITIHEDLKRPELYNRDQLATIFNSCYSLGRGWVVEKDGKAIGVLGGIKHGHIFNPEHMCFTVAFWFVEPEFRGSRAAWLLLKSLVEYCESEELEIALALQTYSLSSHRLLLKMGFKEGERTFRRI